MASKFKAVVLKKGDVVREADTVTVYNQLVWDGFEPSETKESAAAAKTAPKVNTPGANEKTVGSNPS